jgi:hypothetical protein
MLFGISLRARNTEDNEHTKGVLYFSLRYVVSLST